MYRLLSLILIFFIPLTVFAARTESSWVERMSSYLETSWAEGRDILINGTNKYLNFGSLSGISGYGFRDNAGDMEYKDNGGSWTALNSISGGGGSSEWTDEGQILSPNEGEGIRVDYVIATSTATSSSFVGIEVNGDTITDFTGTGLVMSGNSLAADIGSTVQGYDAQLASLAGLVPGVEGRLIESDGLGGFAMVTAATFISDNSILDTADIGVSVQGYNANTSILGSTINANELASEDFGDFTCNGTTCTLDATYATSLDTAYDGGSSITADSASVTINGSGGWTPLVLTQSDLTSTVLDLTNNSGQYYQAGVNLYNSYEGGVGADGDLGVLNFQGEDSASNRQDFVTVVGYMTDNTSGAEYGAFDIRRYINGTSRTVFRSSLDNNGIEVGDDFATGVISSNGNYDLTLQTGNTTTGDITITDGANGNITLTPDGTGNIVLNAVSRMFAAASATLSSAGDFFLDTTDNQFVISDGTNEMVYRGEDVLYKFALASTTIAASGFASGQVFELPTDKDGFEVTQLRCHVVGGTSIVVNLSDGTNDTETTTCGTTVTSDTDVATNDTFTAGEIPEIQLGTVTGTPNWLYITYYGYWTRE